MIIRPSFSNRSCEPTCRSGSSFGDTAFNYHRIDRHVCLLNAKKREELQSLFDEDRDIQPNGFPRIFLSRLATIRILEVIREQVSPGVKYSGATSCRGWLLPRSSRQITLRSGLLRIWRLLPHKARRQTVGHAPRNRIRKSHPLNLHGCHTTTFCESVPEPALVRR